MDDDSDGGMQPLVSNARRFLPSCLLSLVTGFALCLKVTAELICYESVEFDQTTSVATQSSQKLFDSGAARCHRFASNFGAGQGAV